MKKHKCPTCGALVLFAVKARGAVEELYEDWLTDLAAEGRSRFYVGQLRQRFKAYVLPFFGSHRPVDIRTRDLVSLKRELFRNYSLAPKTVRHVLSALSAFLNHLADLGELEAVPRFPQVRVAPSRPRLWLSADAQGRIIEGADPADRLILRLMFETGVRPSEACALQVGDLVDGGLRVCRAFDEYGELKSTKTGSDDVRALSQGLYKALKNSCRAHDPGQFLFTRGGRPYTRRKLRYRWQVACKRAGVEGISLYQGTRHSRASQVRAEAEAQAREMIRASLGHADAATTLKHYALPRNREIGAAPGMGGPAMER